MMLRLMILGLFLLVASLATPPARAHCQIPCGIYGDARQFEILEEHAATIEKSMIEIVALSAASPPDYHMIARWTANKEEHAAKIQEIVSSYFLTQRVTSADPADEPAFADYVRHTTLLHQMLVAAMKAKQTTDIAHVATLRALAAAYQDHYFKPHGHPH